MIRVPVMRNMKNFQGCRYLVLVFFFFSLIKGKRYLEIACLGVENISCSRKSLIHKSRLSRYGLHQLKLSLAHWQMLAMSILPMAMRFMTNPVPAPHGWASFSHLGHSSQPRRQHTGSVDIWGIQGLKAASSCS